MTASQPMTKEERRALLAALIAKEADPDHRALAHALAAEIFELVDSLGSIAYFLERISVVADRR